MISISKSQRDALAEVGLLTIKQKGKGGTLKQDQNFVVTCRTKGGRAKNWYIVENPAIFAFLGMWEKLDLQVITPAQVEKLKTANLLRDSDIQKHGEYNPNAIAYIDSRGQYRIKKIAQLMKELNYWK